MKIDNVLVVGAGVMGRGIAQWFAQQKIVTALCDCQKNIALEAQKHIVQSWKRRHTKGKIQKEDIKDFTEHLTVCDFNDISPKIDLVVEAVFEDKDAKVRMFKELEEKTPHAVLSSNTSSLSISGMGRLLKRKSHFLGLHFFNPAPVMKLVEIILGAKTSPKLGEELKQWFDKRGKKTAVCKDSPGFIVNRVARNYYGEAFRALRSLANIEEHDRVMREVGGFKMGPFELMDLIGIDINYQVTKSIWKSYYREPRFAPHPLQKMMVDSGRLGKKSGEGFYSYE